MDPSGDLQDPKNKNPDVASFGKNVMKLVSGTVISQIIIILSYPILTRLYGPEAFGYLSIFLSLVTIFATIACLRYNYAIVIPENESDSLNILATCCAILLVMSIAISVVILLFGDFILICFDAVEIKVYLFLIPIIVLFEGLFLILKYYNSRKKEFGLQAVANTTQSVSIVVGQLGLGYLRSASTFSLICAEIIGRIIGTTLLAIHFFRHDAKECVKAFQLRKSLALLKRYRKFILVDTWSALVNSLSWQMPVLLLAALFSPTVAGLYGLGFKVFQMPMNLVGSAVEQVFFQGASTRKHLGDLHILLEEVVGVFLMFICVPIIFLSVMGGDLFALFFGETWREAGVYTQILAVWAFVWFMASPLNTMIQVLEIHTIGFVILFVNLVTRALSLIVGGFFNNIYLALALFSISGIFVYGSLLYIYFNKSNASIYIVFKKCKLSLIYAISVPIALYVVIHLGNFGTVSVILVSILCIGVYYIILFKKSDFARKYLQQFLSRSSKYK